MRRPLALSCVLVLVLAACGKKHEEPKTPHDMPKDHHCGEDKVHAHDLDPHEDGATHAFTPCSKDGKHDHAGAVRIESTKEGLHIVVDATDDDFKDGLPGTDVKGRDAVLVYPRGREHKSIEIPLRRTKKGYSGEITIPYAEIDRLNDEGTKLDITIFDHDEKHGNEKHEELRVQVAVSTGKSCEKARDENPEGVDLGQKGPKKPDLTNEQLGGPMKTSAFFAHCGLKDSENAEICVAVKHGKPLGVSVGVTPTNKGAAACIDRAVRKLHWPDSDRLDMVKQKF